MVYRRWFVFPHFSPSIIVLPRFVTRGHNELDEPAFTQPQMYDKIRSRISVPQMYENHLVVRLTLSLPCPPRPLTIYIRS